MIAVLTFISGALVLVFIAFYAFSKSSERLQFPIVTGIVVPIVALITASLMLAIAVRTADLSLEYVEYEDGSFTLTFGGCNPDRICAEGD